MPFVIDASVAACWLLPDEHHQAAEAAFARFPDDTALVPPIFWLELQNICLTCERRGRIDAQFTERALALLKRLPILTDHEVDETALDLARKHVLTAYDASYLALALRMNVSLATLDNALARAAKTEKVGSIT